MSEPTESNEPASKRTPDASASGAQEERPARGPFMYRGRKCPSSFKGMKQAAAFLDLPLDLMKRAVRAGCPAFRSNRVYARELIDWLDAHRVDLEANAQALGGMDGLKQQEVAERVRKLKLANDRHEGALISRAWVVERIQRMFGDIAVMRSKSEAEDAMLFAAANGDPAKCRAIVRTIWDGVLTSMNGLKRHLAEGNDGKGAAPAKTKAKAAP